MDITNAFEITLKIVAIGGSFAGLFLYIGEQKAIIARTQIGIQRLQADVDELKEEIRRLDKADSLVDTTENNIQIRVSYIESFLQRTTKFFPVNTRPNFV